MINGFNIVVDELKNRLHHLWSIYVFGSHASGDALPGSDLDLAVLGASKYGHLELYETGGILAMKIQQDVDLVDLRSVPTDLRARIVPMGKRFIVSEFAQVERFENFVFSSYAKLNDERRFIIQDIEEQGSIHDR